MWEITYRISPDGGYFDKAEPALWEAGVYFEAIHSMDFLADGSVVLVYEIDATEQRLRTVLESAGNRLVDYVITSHADPLVAQIRVKPDDQFERALSTHRSYGLSVDFPIRYLEHDPVTVELVEIGPRSELSDRIEATREYATVDIQQVHRYEPTTGQLFQELTDRQQEVLLTALRKGYYRTPREATHEEIAADLSCSASVVGQHLRRIETKLVSSVVPATVDGESTAVEGD
jgi:DNA-binding CsgD family transcriptional regulator